jgi:hypothetical protein
MPAQNSSTLQGCKHTPCTSWVSTGGCIVHRAPFWSINHSVKGGVCGLAKGCCFELWKAMLMVRCCVLGLVLLSEAKRLCAACDIVAAEVLVSAQGSMATANFGTS